MGRRGDEGAEVGSVELGLLHGVVAFEVLDCANLVISAADRGGSSAPCVILRPNKEARPKKNCKVLVATLPVSSSM